MKNKLLVAGLVAGVIIGGTFAVGASEKDDFARQNDSKMSGIETELETEHGKTFIKMESANGNSETAGKQLTVEQATEIAKRAASGRIEEIETEYENGRLEYKFEFKDGSKETEVRIDALTGEVIRVKLDDDDKDDKERSASAASKVDSNTANDKGYDDKGGNRSDDDSDDTSYDDNSGNRNNVDSDDSGYDDNGGNRNDDDSDYSGYDDNGGNRNDDDSDDRDDDDENSSNDNDDDRGDDENSSNDNDDDRGDDDDNDDNDDADDRKHN
ncbi:PepSY domain-containing protein [Bacillus sp. FJAT-18017]|uniref:PepSY domain-containing protein n=1 Tax=Bacillus sp. FJAT-18017 TaxID=1705566 RepID=UPI0006ADD312|nr:PepSY domain-containing protein [Bacillus sp. FJAT-18017]